VRDCTIASLRRRIAYVPQDPWLFDGTIADNIAFARPLASRAAVVRAAQHALVDGFALTLANGYDTPVGEAGASLSGGQRQRIALARAVLSNASLLAMDEPTSSLDDASAEAILASLDRVSRDRTLVIVSHDLRIAERCDRVVVIDGGVVVQDGPPEVLSAVEGPYATLRAHDLTMTKGGEEHAHQESDAQDDESSPLRVALP
jgi:ABC-type multidrug transport system fused ATPase/permease subunit